MKSKLIIFIIGLVCLISCSDDDTILSLGNSYVDTQSSVTLVDTISVDMSTFIIDSIPTSTSDYVMVGSYTDEYFGTVSSTGYFQIEMPEASIDDDEVFDSMVLILPYSGIYYGDTLEQQTINVHRVLEDIEPDDDNDETYIYNLNSFSYDNDIIGTITLAPKPTFRDSIEINLTDELGEEFFDYLIDDDDLLESSSDFLDYFYGIALVPGSENNSILSFDADAGLKVKLYSHVTEEERTDYEYTFAHSSSEHYISNNITADYSGTNLESLSTQKYEISSSLMGNMAYIQSGMAIVTRVEFPGIAKILEEERYNILYKAELILRPVLNSDKQVSYPKTLVLYETDKYNEVVSQLTDDDGYALTSTFYEDEFYNEDTYYNFDVTEYVYDQLSAGYIDPDSHGLLVMTSESNFQGTLDRVVFDASSVSEYRPVLNLYYIFYE